MDKSLNHLAKAYIRDWIETLGAPAERILYLSTCYYIIGERSEAIRQISSFLVSSNDQDKTALTLKLNLLYYLIEEAVYSSYRSEEIKFECDKIIKDIPFSSLETLPEVMRYPAQDTYGYYEITFGKTKREIEEGIRLCQKAYPEGSSIKSEAHFGILHERTGWRRYLRARG
jgi:hypothetical protein